MATTLISFSSIIVLVLAISSILTLEARPLEVNGLLYNIKTEGSSHRGEGHGSTNAQILGGIKHSGPSRGQGNYHTNRAFSQNLGGMKHSGPSHGGKGNYYTSSNSGSQTLGGMKQSGPSPSAPAAAQYYTTKAPQTISEIKHSGPSAGGPGN